MCNGPNVVSPAGQDSIKLFAMLESIELLFDGQHMGLHSVVHLNDAHVKLMADVSQNPLCAGCANVVSSGARTALPAPLRLCAKQF